MIFICIFLFGIVYEIGIRSRQALGVRNLFLRTFPLDKTIENDSNVKERKEELLKFTNDLLNKHSVKARITYTHELNGDKNFAFCSDYIKNNKFIVLSKSQLFNQDMDFLKATIAHEINHLVNRHGFILESLKSISRFLIYMTFMSSIMITLLGVLNQSLGVIIFGICSILLSVIFSLGMATLIYKLQRSFEYKSDEFAVENSSLDAYLKVNKFYKEISKNDKTSYFDTIFSTHPSWEERRLHILKKYGDCK